MINEQALQGNWNQIKGALKDRFCFLTEDDVHTFNGNVEQLVGLIQRKTGKAREEVQKYLEEVTSETSSAVGKTAQSAQDFASKASETVQESYEQATDRVREGYAEAEKFVRTQPAESVAAAFGAGLVIGLIAGVVLR